MHPAGNLPPRLPALTAPRPLPPALRTLARGRRGASHAAAYRRLADAAAGAGFPDLAAYAYQHGPRSIAAWAIRMRPSSKR